MSNVNRYGLKRTVPSQVKLEVRQRCGFGCVICGLAFYDYEHFDPDFADAKEHNPNGMTLLCPNCNQKRARGRLSADTVAKANADPVCRKQGFASEWFDFGTEPVTVDFSGVSFYDCRHLIVINGVPILSVAPPEAPGKPMRVSGILTNERGEITLKIVENHLSVNAANWDVQCVGANIRVRNGQGDVALDLDMLPPNRIRISKINMRFKTFQLKGDNETLQICIGAGNWNNLSRCSVSHCTIGINIEVGAPAANEPLFDNDE